MEKGTGVCSVWPFGVVGSFLLSTPPEADDLIIHAQFKKWPFSLMMSDTFGKNPVETGNNISFTLEMESEEEINEIYSRLTDKGTGHMELQDTFWGAKYAKVKDPFGMTWDLNFQK